jgi:chromosome segregation ATPase
MDTERTMQFILDNMAALTVSQQKGEIRIARIERQMAGLQTLVKTGMRMMVKLQQSHQKLEASMRALTQAQAQTKQALAELAAQHKRTDQKFERWLDSMNKGSNGQKKS